MSYYMKSKRINHLGELEIKCYHTGNEEVVGIVPDNSQNKMGIYDFSKEMDERIKPKIVEQPVKLTAEQAKNMIDRVKQVDTENQYNTLNNTEKDLFKKYFKTKYFKMFKRI